MRIPVRMNDFLIGQASCVEGTEHSIPVSHTAVCVYRTELLFRGDSVAVLCTYFTSGSHNHIDK